MVSADVIAELQPSMLRHARRYAATADAEDLVQDALLRLVEKEPEWRGLPQFHVVRRWAFTTMRNLAVSRARSEKKRPDVVAVDGDGAHGLGAAPCDLDGRSAW